MPRTLAAGVLLSLVAVPAAAQSGGIRAVGTRHPGAAAAAAVRGSPAGGVRPLPMSLPPTAASAARAAPRRWLVGAVAGARSTALARRFGARRVIPGTGIFVLPRSRANSFAGALREQRLLVYAEPDRRVRVKSFPTDLLTPGQWWLGRVASGAPTPPAVTSRSPLMVDIDSQVDLSHPEIAQSNIRSLDPSAPVTDEHGTAVAAVAGAPADGLGIVGVWPGMRVLVVPAQLYCDEVANDIGRAITLHAAVINMSFGGSFCATGSIADGLATGSNIVLVASAGNEFDQGNQPEYPASDPHVISVAATDEQNQPAFFSNSNGGIDLAAPGTNILTATPLAYDQDGPPDGFAHYDGTSFSAPMVSAAAAWLRQIRPDLTQDQVQGILDASAVDAGPKGWDQSFGWGVLNIKAALPQRAPPRDPEEPNDDVFWVNGQLLRPNPYFFTGSRATALDDHIDLWEDPADVYRIRVLPHSTVRITLRPSGGDSDLFVYSRSARSIYDNNGNSTTRDLIDASVHDGTVTDSSIITNTARRADWAYVAVTIDPGGRTLNSFFRLSAQRIR